MHERWRCIDCSLVEIWHGLDKVAPDFGDTAVTIGVFDGIHRGHRVLVDRTVAAAAAHGYKSVLVTFDPNPAALFAPDGGPVALTTIARRAELVAAAGVDAMLVIPFTKEFAGLSPEEFVREVLGRTLQAKQVFVGQNFSYGKKAAGNAETLQTQGAELGIDVTVVPLVDVHGKGAEPEGAEGEMNSPESPKVEAGELTRVSSTVVRGLLAEGQVGQAAGCLGYFYRLDGAVVHGQGRGGAELGYPTANLEITDGLALPADGVYAAWFSVSPTEQLPEADITGDIAFGVRYPAAVSIGSNVTFGEHIRTVEAYIIGRSGNIYGAQGHLEFVERIRGMEKFDSVAALVARMRQDVEETLSILENHNYHC